MKTRTHNRLAFFGQCLLINLAATVVAIAFNATNYGLQIFASPRYIISAFVYSNCIGTLISVVIFFISPHWIKNPTIIRFAKVFISIFVATFIGVTFAGIILNSIFQESAIQTIIPTWQMFVFSLGIALTFGFGAYFYEVSQSKLRQKELDEEKAKTLAGEAQLASLESRIHPHFLFNTLNSIAALIREEPALAEKTVEKLSALLRYSLDEHAKGMVTLAHELEITEKYLEIEKIRFDKRLAYKIECEPRFLETKIPPLSLQTLVENSIKHVAAKTSEKTEIVISALENDGSIEIFVRDNGTGFSENDLKINHGLDNLRKRLQTIFADNADLQIIRNPHCAVKLTIPK